MEMTFEQANKCLGKLKENIESVFVGKSEAVEYLLVGLLARGHVLIEDVPGVGKTVLAKALARSIHCKFCRIQLTPDMLPSDIIGVSVYDNRTHTFEFNRGPIFANIVLADEINRTTPRTQASLLEAMNETQVSVDGKSLKLEPPFMVIATQNPFEFEGTYFLPENQLDRFLLRIHIGYPDREAERLVLTELNFNGTVENLEPVCNAGDVPALQERVRQVRMDDALIDYVLNLTTLTRQDERIEVGASPRAGMGLVRAARARALLAERNYVIPDDIKGLITPVLAHRLVTRSFYESGPDSNPVAILDDIALAAPVPV